MSRYKLTLTRIETTPDSLQKEAETVVYTQHFDDLDVSELIRELNRPRRVYKKRTPKTATPGS